MYSTDGENKNKDAQEAFNIYIARGAETARKRSAFGQLLVKVLFN